MKSISAPETNHLLELDERELESVQGGLLRLPIDPLPPWLRKPVLPFPPLPLPRPLPDPPPWRKLLPGPVFPIRPIVF